VTEPIQNITIVGLGLLGSSLAACLKNRHPSPIHITGVSSTLACNKALQSGLIDTACSYEDFSWTSNCDVCILCTPISHIISYLTALGSHPLPPGCVITDVGSTKVDICNHALQVLPDSVHFIGGHPMAGSEKNGIDAMDEALFENAYWILCPQNNQAAALHKVKQFLQSTNSHLVYLDPTTHDFLMAYLSHSPQIISSALSASIPDHSVIKGNFLHLAGRGFRDMTRIAASGYPMWKDIFNTNRHNILQSLHDFKDTLQAMISALAELPQSEPQLHTVFEKGVKNRMQLSQPGKGFSQVLNEIIVQIDDEPGMIAKVVSPLSTAGVNIMDIELLKVREGIDGTLLLAFKNDEEATLACSVLSKLGYSARLR
jgi:prephenate dehydrogenase